MRSIALAFVVSCWLVLAMAFAFRKRPARRREVRRNPAWKFGLFLQVLAFVAVFAAPRGRIAPIAAPGTPGEAAAGVLAIVLASASTWVLLAAKKALGIQFAYQARLVEGHKLVTSGPYSFVRNPMYTAVLGLLLALGLVWTNWPGLAVAMALGWIGGVLRVRSEEKLLREAFGREFEEYARRVPALVPRLRR